MGTMVMLVAARPLLAVVFVSLRVRAALVVVVVDADVVGVGPHKGKKAQEQDSPKADSEKAPWGVAAAGGHRRPVAADLIGNFGIAAGSGGGGVASMFRVLQMQS